MSTQGASARKLALTFDDSPVLKTYLFKSNTEQAQALLAGLHAAKVDKVAFFVIAKGLEEAEGLKVIRLFDAGGHWIANHSFSHQRYSKVSFKNYAGGFDKADELLKGFKNFTRYYRFPMLDEGGSRGKVDLMRAHLKKHAYQQGYVTIDSNEWYLREKLEQASKKGLKINKKALCDLYSEIIVDASEFHDHIAQSYLGRSPKHVLLLHENDIAALCIERLLNDLRSRDWNIIAPEDAFDDPVSGMLPKTTILGQGRTMALAIDAGYKGPYVAPLEPLEKINQRISELKVFE